MVRNRGSNFTDQLGSLHLPSIFTYLPHLTGHPDSLKPVYKLSNNRFGGKYTYRADSLTVQGAIV